MALPSTYPRRSVDTLQTGVLLGITPSTPGFTVELQRMPESGGNPDTGNATTIATRTFAPIEGFRYFDPLPADNTPYYYRFRLTLTGYTAGAWSEIVGPARATVYEKKPNEGGTQYPIRRDVKMGDGKFATTAIDALGEVLYENVGYDDGVAVRKIVSGRQNIVAQDGDAVTFSPAYQSPPLVIVVGGVTYEPRSGSWSPSFTSTLPQYELRHAKNITASGCDIEAVLYQKGAQTGQTDEFPNNNLLDAVGETAEANLDPAVAANDTYYIHFRRRIRVICPNPGKPPLSVTVVLAIDTNDGGGWVERTTISTLVQAIEEECPGAYFEQDDTHVVKQIVVSGLGLNDDVRLRVKDIVNPNNLYDAILVHGFHGTAATPNDPASGVTYNTATNAYASMTPDAEDTLEVDSIAVE